MGQKSPNILKSDLNELKMRKRKPFVIAAIAAAVVLLALMPIFIKSIYWLGIIETVIIWSIFSMGLDLLVGYGGLMSMGHGAYFGFAAYTLGILTTKFGANTATGIICALLFSGLLALIVGLLASHLRGLTFMMVTIAICQVVWGCAMQMTSLTNGDNGLSGISRPIIGGHVLTNNQFFYFVLIIALICTALLVFLTRSPYGLAVRGVKQTETRMRVLGYNVWLYKVITNVLSGLIAGCAGMLYAFYTGFVGVNDVAVTTGSKALLMVLTGGAGTLFGPIIGSTVLVFIENLVSSFTQRWNLIMGLMYIIVVMFLPNGIIGIIKDMVAKRKKKLVLLPK